VIFFVVSAVTIVGSGFLFEFILKFFIL